MRSALALDLLIRIVVTVSTVGMVSPDPFLTPARDHRTFFLSDRRPKLLSYSLPLKLVLPFIRLTSDEVHSGLGIALETKTLL